MKKDPENGQLFTREQLLGNIYRILFLGLFREKEKAYLGSFFMGQKILKVKVCGSSGNSQRTQLP
jgi:hypothetical protein